MMRVPIVVALAFLITLNLASTQCPSGTPSQQELQAVAPEQFVGTSVYPSAQGAKNRAFIAPLLSGLNDDVKHMWFDDVSNSLLFATRDRIYVSASPFSSANLLLSSPTTIEGIATNLNGSHVFFSTNGNEIVMSPTTANSTTVRLSGLSRDWGVLFRSGDRIYGIVDGLNCLRYFSTLDNSPATTFGCICYSGSGSARDGPFSDCKLGRPAALACQSTTSLSPCYVTNDYFTLWNQVLKLSVTTDTASFVFRAPSNRKFSAALFVHPSEEDTLLIAAADGRSPQLFYHDSSMTSKTAFIGMVDEGRDPSETYLCKAEIKNELKAMAFNPRTGELYFANGDNEIGRIRYFLGNMTRTTRLSPTLSSDHSPSPTMPSTVSSDATRTAGVRPTDTKTSSITLTPAVTPTTSSQAAPTSTIAPSRTTTQPLTTSLAYSSTRKPRTSVHGNSSSSSTTVHPTSTGTTEAPFASRTSTASFTTTSELLQSSTRSSTSSISISSSTLASGTQSYSMSSPPSISSSSSMRSETTTWAVSTSTSLTGTATSHTETPTRETESPRTPAPPLEPGERCQSPPPRPSPLPVFTVEENTVATDRVTLRWNLTDTIIDASTWSRGENNPIAIPATAFAVVFRPPPAGEAPAGGGFVQYIVAGKILGPQANTSLVVNPATLQATLSFGPLPRYTIRAVAERLNVFLTAAWFINGSRFCGNRVRTVRISRINVEPSPDALLADAKVANEVIGDTALAASVVSAGGGGGGAAGDVTSVAILSTMSCASPEQRQTGANARLLAPIPLGDSTEGMLLGNLVLVAVVTLLHGGATALLVHRRGLARLPLIAMALTRFPSWSVAVGGVVHQGTVFLSLRLLVGGAASSGGGVALGVFGALYSVLMPVVAVALGMRKIDAVFVEYDYSQETDERPEGPPKRWLQMLLPRGRWEPRDMRRAYGVMLSPFAKTNPLWFLFLFMSPSVIAIGAAPTPDGEDGCVQQYAVIAALQLVYVGVLAVCRPYRSVFANVTASLSAATVSVVAIASAMAVHSPQSIIPVHLSAGVMMVQGGVTIIRVMYTMLMILRERKITQGVFLRPVMRRCPQRHPFDLEEVQCRPPLNNRYFVPPPLSVADIPPDDDDFLSTLNQPLLVEKVVDAGDIQRVIHEEMGSITDEAAVFEEVDDGHDMASLMSGPTGESVAEHLQATQEMVEVTAAEMAGLLGTKLRQGDDLMDILAHVEQQRGTRMVALEQQDLTNQPGDDHADPLGESDDSFLCDAANLDVL